LFAKIVYFSQKRTDFSKKSRNFVADT